jgi:putative transposase
LAERGVPLSYGAARLWCLKFGSTFARKLRHRRSRPGDTWHLDELFIRIRGKRYYLRRKKVEPMRIELTSHRAYTSPGFAER